MRQTSRIAYVIYSFSTLTIQKISIIQRAPPSDEEIRRFDIPMGNVMLLKFSYRFNHLRHQTDSLFSRQTKWWVEEIYLSRFTTLHAKREKNGHIKIEV